MTAKTLYMSLFPGRRHYRDSEQYDGFCGAVSLTGRRCQLVAGPHEWHENETNLLHPNELYKWRCICTVCAPKPGQVEIPR